MAISLGGLSAVPGAFQDAQKNFYANLASQQQQQGLTAYGQALAALAGGPISTNPQLPTSIAGLNMPRPQATPAVAPQNPLVGALQAKGFSNVQPSTQDAPYGASGTNDLGDFSQGLQPQFASALNQAIADAEKATGQKVQINEAYRDSKTQAQYYANYTGKPVTWQGVTYTPLKQGGLAAAPGQSLHQQGLAADIQPGPALDWLHQNAGKYGLSFLPGAAGTADPVHIQWGGGADGSAPTGGGASGVSMPSTAGVQPGTLTWASAVNAIKAANPKISPAALAMATNQLIPLMQADQAQQWKQIDEQRQNQQLELDKQKALLAAGYPAPGLTGGADTAGGQDPTDVNPATGNIYGYDQLDKATQKLIDDVISAKQPTSVLAKGLGVQGAARGQRLLGIATAQSQAQGGPPVDANLYGTRTQVMKSLAPGGAWGNVFTYGQNGINHMASAYDAFTQMGNIGGAPLINSSINDLQNKAKSSSGLSTALNAFQLEVQNAVAEMSKFYAAGGQSALGDRQALASIFDPKKSPAEILSALQAQVINFQAKLEDMNSQIAPFKDIPQLKLNKTTQANLDRILSAGENPAVPGTSGPAVPTGAATPAGPAPEGQIIQMQDGTYQIKKNGQWVPYG